MAYKSENGYFEINTDDSDNKPRLSFDLTDLFYTKDLKQRKMFINDPIFMENIVDVVHFILQFNAEDKGIPVEERKPILLYLTSAGGSVDCGFQLINIIEHSKTPVYTINTGFQYSMGFLIGLAGHKRFAMKNSKFLMHDGFNGTFDSSAKVVDTIEFRKKEEQRIKDYILSRTKITSELYDKQYRVEWYMYGDEAKELGVVDCIIGEDCSIDEIV